MKVITLRENSDEKYVLDLIADIMGENYEWQKRFDTLVGDPGKNARRSKLPVDAYFPESNLIVEYREKQHLQPVGFMDKRITISGISRGEQRKIYDRRKEQWSAENNVNLLIVNYGDLAHKANGRLMRTPDFDKLAISRLIESLEMR